MKKEYCLLYALIFCVVIQACAQRDGGNQSLRNLSVSLLAGISLHKKHSMNYGEGFGIKGSADLNRFNLSVAAIKHAGDELSIRYGGVSGLGIKSGTQKYSWRSTFLVIDAGYNINIFSVGDISAVFIPAVSTGLGLINMHSSGIYGSPDNVVNKKMRFGGCLSYKILFGPRYAVGLNYRFYLPTDASFEFGQESNSIRHGFSTGIYYDAFFSEFSYRF